MVKMPKCRPFLDFDVKRQWFKTQVRRLRQQANRRHGSLRLNLRRKHVFEDSFHAFNHRSAEELRGRLQITFVDEEGVDAGGLSREFFAILAKEMFNPNYALFMSTEDGCTFQPNPNSSINLDHLRYFRFVGRIVGKAVVDGFLLDAHFTRSLYKHMLGIKVRSTNATILLFLR
jgi:E3 ubiquitin-protein ligase HUWE1